MLTAPDRLPADDLVRAGTVAAAVLARRGMLARSAELYRWVGAAAGRASAVAVPALIGTGALDEAREVLHGSIPVRPRRARRPGAGPAADAARRGRGADGRGRLRLGGRLADRGAVQADPGGRAAGDLVPGGPAARHPGRAGRAGRGALRRARRGPVGAGTGGPDAAGRAGRGHPAPAAARAGSRCPAGLPRRPGRRCGRVAARRRAGAARRAVGRGAGGGAGPAHRRPGLADAGMGPGPGGHRAASGGPVRTAAAR